MASKKHGTNLLLMIVVTMLCAGAMAQSSSCTNALISMSPCLNYITGNSSTPSSGCCTQLANVVGSKPECLCEVLKGGGSSMGLNINQTQAEALPGACKVQTPPVSKCNAASPGNSSPGTPTSSTPTSSNTPSSQGPNTGHSSNTVPSTDSGSSDADSTKMAVPLVFFLLFASSALTSTMF